jgi:hypothetical protein
MDIIRNCMLIAVTTLCMYTHAQAQTVYYPAVSSKLLKETAEDVAKLLQQAMPGNTINAQAYTQTPTTGLVLAYNSNIIDNQACKVQSTGGNLITFTAAEDNGLHFGLYQYLNNLGFRFYQPGSIWQITPTITTVFKQTDTVYTTAYKYKTWFVSGGHSRWVMDNNAIFNWDTYFGENGHSWALYQRRNGMLGAYGFRGHRGDMMSATGTYMQALKNNPCFVANFNGSRAANVQSVPDIFNSDATSLWANAIQEKHTAYRNTILNSGNFYINQVKNFSYGNAHVGIEVPDGGLWGNSTANETCGAKNYPKPSDQQFTLGNITAKKILNSLPNQKFQLYAYASHADVPSASISINKNIDVQLIPTVYQLETSVGGIRNRWYNRHQSVSEYQYLNLSGWSGETPQFNWSDLEKTLQIAKDKKTQGVVWEASPSKFASLPYLLAANTNLINGTSIENTLQEFCNNMFADAAPTVYEILQKWGNSHTAPSKHRMQLYLQLLSKADAQTKNASPIVKERMLELKAYVHYMVMLFDVNSNDQQKVTKEEKDAALCLYLARTNRLQLVNSYYVITTIVARYGSGSAFYTKYNTTNGTAYLNGQLPLLTATEIENDFKQDVARYTNKIQQFSFNTTAQVKNNMADASLTALEKIDVVLGYTNGANYYARTAFNIVAPKAGKFVINYTPRFDEAGKGYMNFLVENTDKALQVITDASIDNLSASGSITVNLQAAGNYQLTVTSKHKTAADICIKTNGNYFYKSGVFIGSKIESYKNNMASLPGYFYVPAGLNKAYFSVSNSFVNNKFATASTIGNSFLIKNSKGQVLNPQLEDAADSTLFYLDVPASNNGTFLQITNVGQYNLQFINISNLLWYAQPGVIKKNETETNANSQNQGQLQPVAVVYPSPSTGVFNCMVDGKNVKADEVNVFTTSGNKVATFKGVSQFNITNALPGMYIYQFTANGITHKGKIMKQ